MSQESKSDSKANGENRGAQAAGNQPAAAQSASATPSPTAAKERRFRVMETISIPSGGASYTLRAGKTISSFGYDIGKLKALGVKLAEEPA